MNLRDKREIQGKVEWKQGKEENNVTLISKNRNITLVYYSFC